ncbi:MAG: DUF2934 domain-containing protein [Terracidiphilus sp.]|jgi:hypothetical protein
MLAAIPTEGIRMADTTKKTKATAKIRTPATKKEKVTKGSKPSREEIELLAKRYWAERGYKDGYAEQDWLRAEKELLKAASHKTAS